MLFCRWKGDLRMEGERRGWEKKRIKMWYVFVMYHKRANKKINIYMIDEGINEQVNHQCSVLFPHLLLAGLHLDTTTLLFTTKFFLSLCWYLYADEILGFKHAKQALYHWSTVPTFTTPFHAEWLLDLDNNNSINKDQNKT